MTRVSGASTSTATKENCTVTVEGPDSYTYELTHLHLPKDVFHDWEMKDGTSLAKDGEFYQEKVSNLTKNSITMKNCTEYLRAFGMNLGIREETICRVNCSALLEQEHPQPVVINERWCLSEDFCGWKAALCVTVLAIVLLVVVSIAFIWMYRRRRAAQRASYTPANKGIEMVAVQIDQQN